MVNQHALAGSAPALSRIAEFESLVSLSEFSIQYRAADDRQSHEAQDLTQEAFVRAYSPSTPTGAARPSTSGCTG